MPRSYGDLHTIVRDTHNKHLCHYLIDLSYATGSATSPVHSDVLSSASEADESESIASSGDTFDSEPPELYAEGQRKWAYTLQFIVALLVVSVGMGVVRHVTLVSV